MIWTIDPACAVQAGNVRRACVSHLASEASGDSDVPAAASIIAEILANAVEHGEAPIEMVLRWENGAAIAEVHDRGVGFESKRRVLPEPTSSRGRGLYLVQELSEGLHVYRKKDDGTVVCARLPVRRR
ncbi:MAG: ATP-binding protein [Candidatus Eremiobacteraeota bacterium]|nr:ATP-binding protein [Candidatus Eremiobacteraeota bacterium]